jgi:flagellar hook protein FlgE
MSFNIALSGLGAAQKDLDTTANNIANVNTVGFKESRAEFGDVYASSLLAGGKTKVGDGVLTAEVAQQFSQGSLSFTNNSLDLAVAGTGFFSTVPEQSSRDYAFTRAGQFKLNEDNFVVNSGGDHLLGFPVNPDGTSSSVALSTTEPVRIPDSSGSPQSTSEVDLRFNLPADGQALNPAEFDLDDPLTYNAATSVTIYDSLGDSHVMTYYFIKDGTNYDPATDLQADGVTPVANNTNRQNEWLVVAAVDGQLVNMDPNDPTVDMSDPAQVDALPNSVGSTITTPVSAARLMFSSGGDFQGLQGPIPPTLAGSGQTVATPGQVQQLTEPGIFELNTLPLGDILLNGSDTAQAIKIDFNFDPTTPTPNEPTQFASNFEVTSLEQDGLPVGRLTGVDIGPDGLVRATFSNGTSTPISRVALVRFANEQGLTQAGSTNWKASILSGEPLAGEATTGTFGNINSSALEQSNVNLTTELVDMIIAQRNFQANSRALEVNNQLNQTVLNIR